MATQVTPTIQDDAAKQNPKTSSDVPQKKDGSELDEKTPVITNTDLITFTVTVTDIYGRFVSGLGKNAFSKSLTIGS